MPGPKVKLDMRLWMELKDLKATLDSRLPMKIDAVTCTCRASCVSMLVFLSPTSKPCPACGSLVLLQCATCECFMCAGCLEDHARKYRTENEVDTVSDLLLQRDRAKNGRGPN